MQDHFELLMSKLLVAPLSCSKCPYISDLSPAGLPMLVGGQETCTLQDSVYPECAEVIGSTVRSVLAGLNRTIQRHLMLDVFGCVPGVQLLPLISAVHALEPSNSMGYCRESRTLYFTESILFGCPDHDLSPARNAVATALAILTLMTEPLWPREFDEEAVRERVHAWRYELFTPSMLTNLN